MKGEKGVAGRKEAEREKGQGCRRDHANGTRVLWHMPVGTVGKGLSTGERTDSQHLVRVMGKSSHGRKITKKKVMGPHTQREHEKKKTESRTRTHEENRVKETGRNNCPQQCHTELTLCSGDVCFDIFDDES